MDDRWGQGRRNEGRRNEGRRDEGWRVEADDEWLAAHKSANFARLRRRLASFGMIGDAVSMAELGPFGGPKRNPQLKIGGKTYAFIRPAEHRISYTTIQIDLDTCRRCGERLVEVHKIMRVTEDGVRQLMGAVRMCRVCRSNSWLFHSRMPGAVRARARARRVVL